MTHWIKASRNGTEQQTEINGKKIEKRKVTTKNNFIAPNSNKSFVNDRFCFCEVHRKGCGAAKDDREFGLNRETEESGTLGANVVKKIGRSKNDKKIRLQPEKIHANLQNPYAKLAAHCQCPTYSF